MSPQSRIVFDTSVQRFAPGQHRDACNMCGDKPDQIIIVCLPWQEFLPDCLHLCEPCIRSIHNGDQP